MIIYEKQTSEGPSATQHKYAFGWEGMQEMSEFATLSTHKRWTGCLGRDNSTKNKI